MAQWQIDTSGPLFQKDVRKTVRQNMQTALMASATEGREIVQAQLSPGHGYLTGQLHDHIVATNKSISGQPWALSAVARSSLFQKLGSDSYTSKIEAKYHMFRAARGAIRMLNKLIQADYTKGLE